MLGWFIAAVVVNYLEHLNMLNISDQYFRLSTDTLFLLLLLLLLLSKHMILCIKAALSVFSTPCISACQLFLILWFADVGLADMSLEGGVLEREWYGWS